MRHGRERGPQTAAPIGAKSPERGDWSDRFPIRAVSLRLYQFCDALSGPLICLALVFSPWAFGTTVSWTVWTMNGVGYALGGLLAVKLFLRWRKWYAPPRWGISLPGATARTDWSQLFVHPLAWLTVAILGYCLISAVNARATYHRAGQSFDYHRYLEWLPHSLDSASSWPVFWNYLALACLFWAIRDWLLGKTRAEQLAERTTNAPEASTRTSLMPARLRLMLWVLAINGGLLAVEGIAQRIEGSGNLLFMVKPRVNPDAVTQFGPYAYRANASQYFNLLWPVCLGFWWMLQQEGGRRRGAHHWLLLCSALMAACPIISTSRGGALITVVVAVAAITLLVATHFFLAARRQQSRRARIVSLIAVGVFFVAALGLGYGLGWKELSPRMKQIHEGFTGREQMFDAARPMAADYPVFGTGPGTFETVFQLYRVTTDTYWPAQLHNDWLETRITFGWVGSAMIALAFVLVVLRWYLPGGIQGGRRFMLLTWLALAGCLAHARFDFPFQIYSIVLLFLTWCAMLSTLTRRP